MLTSPYQVSHPSVFSKVHRFWTLRNLWECIKECTTNRNTDRGSFYIGGLVCWVYFFLWFTLNNFLTENWRCRRCIKLSTRHVGHDRKSVNSRRLQLCKSSWAFPSIKPVYSSTLSKGLLLCRNETHSVPADHETLWSFLGLWLTIALCALDRRIRYSFTKIFA